MHIVAELPQADAKVKPRQGNESFRCPARCFEPSAPVTSDYDKLGIRRNPQGVNAAQTYQMTFLMRCKILFTMIFRLIDID